MEAGDKFVNEARGILAPESPSAHPANFRERYGLRGNKLFGLLVGIILLAILTVYSTVICVYIVNHLILSRVVIYKMRQ